MKRFTEAQKMQQAINRQCRISNNRWQALCRDYTWPGQYWYFFNLYTTHPDRPNLGDCIKTS
jgi:hypothetical protein